MDRSALAITLCTPRLVVRPLTLADRAVWVKTEHENATFWAVRAPRQDVELAPEERFAEVLERSDRGWIEGTGYRFAAFMGEAIVGSAALNNVTRRAFQNADMGWKVTEAAQGRGLAFEMGKGIMDWAFAPAPGGAGLHRIQANIGPDNERSLRLADRLGFRREGLALRMLNISGAWRDHVMTAKTAEEHVQRDAR